MAPLSPRRAISFSVLGAALLAATLYANSLSGPFVYDDVVEIRDNDRVHALANVPELAVSDFWGAGEGRNPLYRPLTAIVTTAAFVSGGGSPLPFHLLNLSLHAGACGLSVLLLIHLTQRRDIALMGGLLFAAHPIHTEAVAWISGLGELMSAVGVLAAWIAHLRGRVTIAGTCFGLAVLSKESAVIFPLLALLGDAMSSGSVRQRWRQYAGYAGVLWGYAALRWMVLGHLLGGSAEAAPLLNPLREGSTMDRLLTAGIVLGLAARQSAAPVTLCLDYGYNQIPKASGLADPRLLLSALILAVMVTLIRVAPSRRRSLIIGFLLFLVSFFPVSNVLFPAISIFAERNLYLPSLGFCLVAASLLLPGGGARLPPWAGWSVAAILLVAGAMLTVVRNAEFGDPLRLYASAVQACPSSARAHSFYGIALREAGRPEEAAARQRAALAIRRDYAAARAELGLSLLRSGDAASAERELKEALRLDPADREARTNLAWIYAETGRLADALAEYRATRDQFPNDPEVVGNFAGALLDAGRVEEARGLFRRLTADHPSSPRGPVGLGALLAREGRWDLAADMFKEALRRKPRDLNATHNLALALARTGRVTEALQVLERAMSGGINDPSLFSLRESLRGGAPP